jgi:hypothetical protein
MNRLRGARPSRLGCTSESITGLSEAKCRSGGRRSGSAAVLGTDSRVIWPLWCAVHASPRVVKEVLGHSGIAITMNTYAHVLPTLLGDALTGMDDLLGGTAEEGNCVRIDVTPVPDIRKGRRSTSIRPVHDWWS